MFTCCFLRLAQTYKFTAVQTAQVKYTVRFIRLNDTAAKNAELIVSLTVSIIAVKEDDLQHFNIVMFSNIKNRTDHHN